MWTNFGPPISKIQSVIFYQVNFLCYLRISIFVKAFVNGLGLLSDFPVTSHISIHVLFSVARFQKAL